MNHHISPAVSRPCTHSLNSPPIPSSHAPGAVNLPSGYIGLARSTDGLAFDKVTGPVAGGAVFGPSESKAGGFDDLHVGIGDVQWDAVAKKWVMYYFGGDDSYGPTPYGQARGIFMKIGRAESEDGLHWRRAPGVLLDRGTCGRVGFGHLHFTAVSNLRR